MTMRSEGAILLDAVRFPIGRFMGVKFIMESERLECVQEIPRLVPKLRSILGQLDQNLLYSPYRQGGWTPTQIVHHLADNDMNAYLRFKRALTEQNPVASSYREDLWGELHDYRELHIGHSLILLESLHHRFYVLLQGMKPPDFGRMLVTEALGQISLDIAVQRFVWHHRHHRAQIHSMIGDAFE